MSSPLTYQLIGDIMKTYAACIITHTLPTLFTKLQDTPYCKISQSLEAARLRVKVIVSLWHLKFDQRLILNAPNCQISERLYNPYPISQDFEISQDLVVRRAYPLANRGPWGTLNVYAFNCLINT